MPKPIERLRYYDGEFLRSADLDVEQGYHLEMRRRLNRALHLYGIVDGLELANDSDADKAGLQIFSVRPGMAIDAFGRELIVLDSIILDEQLLLLNQITTPGTYSVWICYQERLSTPTSVGFQRCGFSGSEQLTRWREECKLMLFPQGMVMAAEPENQPKSGLGGIPVGAATVEEVSGRLQFTNALKDSRQAFAGLRAQRIVFPEKIEKINILAKDEPPTARRWLTVEPNAALRANQVIGENYGIKEADFQTKPTPDALPDTGNLKIAGSMFARGNYYQYDGAKWRTLDEYIAARVPEVVVGSNTITVPGGGVAGETASSVVKFNITSSVVDADQPKVVVSLTAFKFKTKDDFDGWYSKIPGNISMQISIEQTSITSTLNGTYEVQFTWKVGPYTNSGGTETLMLESFTYSYVAVLKPKLS